MDESPDIPPGPRTGLLDLYDEALPQVYGYLLRRCGNQALAEELTSEAFLAAVAALHKPDAPSLSIAWLIGVARHKLVDHWRREEREQRVLRLTHSAAPENDDPWDAELDAVWAREVLSDLGPHHRMVLTLRYADGLPVPDVAEQIGRTVDATEALLVRARRAFRRHYDQGNDA